MYLVSKLIESYLTHEASFSEVALKVFGQRTSNGRLREKYRTTRSSALLSSRTIRCISNSFKNSNDTCNFLPTRTSLTSRVTSNYSRIEFHIPLYSRIQHGVIKLRLLIDQRVFNCCSRGGGEGGGGGRGGKKQRSIHVMETIASNKVAVLIFERK